MVSTNDPQSRRPSQPTNVLLLAPYPAGTAPSQRFRFEQYLEPLAEIGYRVELRSLLRGEEYARLYQHGAAPAKAAAVCKGVARRIADLLRARRYDFAVVHREAFPVGPPVVERALGRLGIPFLYDFDDAIYLPNVSDANQRLAFLKVPLKTERIARSAALVSAGNEHLADWARRHNRQVVVLPTTIDTARYRPVARETGAEVCIGWSGSQTTSPYLEMVAGLLADLQRKHRVRLRFIGAPDFKIPGAEVEALPWRLETELADLSEIDVGIMPLPDDEWTRGKCGFKALLYMAMGIPTVMSPVGVNRAIAADGAAVLADDLEGWRAALERLIADPEARHALGERGRQRVEERYSVRAVLPLYAEVMERMTRAGAAIKRP